MAQFTVYRNKNPRTRTAFPFLVDVQSDLLEDLQTRVVIPLSKAAALTRKPVSHLMPMVDFEDGTYVLLTPELAGIARSDLGAAAGSLAQRRDVILAALDFLITGF
jgi:toxin CcdB